MSRYIPGSTLEQAEKLRANIVKYWEAQGYPREALKIEAVMDGADAVIRSGLVNGRPPGKPVRAPEGDAC